MSLPWAEFISYWANLVLVGALLLGLLATGAIFVSGNVKEAHLKQDVTDAQKTLRKFREPRRAILAGHDEEIIGKLKQFPGTPFDSAFDLNSAEQADFWQALEPLLVNSNWKHLPWSNGATMPLFMFNAAGQPQKPLPASGPAAAKNVEIHVPPESRAKLGPPATALMSALNKIGIVTSESEANVVSINKDAIHIEIGEKQ
jgi:hypothetical protein